MDLLELATLFCLCVVKNLPIAFITSGMLPSADVHVLLAVMMLPSYLDVLVYEQLDVFVGRNVHRRLIDFIPKCALNGVFKYTLLETMVPMMLRGK